MIDSRVLRLFAHVANKTLPWEATDNFNWISQDISDLFALYIVQPFDLDPYLDFVKTHVRELPELWIQRGIDNWYNANVPGSFFVIGSGNTTTIAGWDTWRSQLCNALTLGRFGFDSGAYIVEAVAGDGLNKHLMSHSDTAPHKLQFYESVIASPYTTATTISQSLTHWEQATPEQRNIANPKVAEWYNHVNDPFMLSWYLRNPQQLIDEAYPVTSMVELEHSLK